VENVRFENDKNIKFNVNWLKGGVKNKGISQTIFADQIDESYTTINKYKNKRRSSIEYFNKLAVVL